MANVIAGGADSFRALAYEAPSQNALTFIANHAMQETQRLTDAGAQWVGSVGNAFVGLYQNTVRTVGRAIKKLYNSYWDASDIRCLTTTEDLQSASLVNQRWIMANPMARQMFHDGTINGYSTSYVDHGGKVYGADHYDWRRVHDGLVLETKEGGWESTEYVEELDEGDRHLELDEQNDIRRMWGFMEAILAKNEDDPTSIHNEPIG